MSAKSLTACSFEPAAEQRVAIGYRARGGAGAEIAFREVLWREYRLEAINAGFSTAQATAYASALSLETGPVAGLSEMAPVGRRWFYQSRAAVVRRTITSGLIERTHLGESKATGRSAVADASMFAHGFRWWNTRERS